MEEIHFKTVDPVSQELLRLAAREGIELNWERWEKQQPLDGFLRLGLSCPYGCLQGPCRIDPFDRFARRGICGIDRDTMAAGLLLRICLQGALETWADVYGRESQEEAPETTVESAEDEEEIDCRDLTEASALLARPGVKGERLLAQSLRLCLLSLGLAGIRDLPEKEGRRSLQVGYGLLTTDAPLLAVTGQVDEECLTRMDGLLKKENPAARLISLGEWLPWSGAYLPIVSSRGEAELVLVSRKFQLVLAGHRADPGVLFTAGELGLPVIDISQLEDAGVTQIIKKALAKKEKGRISPDQNQAGKAEVLDGVSACKAALGAVDQEGFVFLGGSDSLTHSLGHLPYELAGELSGRGKTVITWGDAAVWMMKQNLPVTVVEPECGPLSAIFALRETGKMDKLGGICFLGLERARDLTQALGLAAMGLKVAVATCLPLWGSRRLGHLLTEMLGLEGGSFTHFDHPVTADELLQWFTGNK
jgi:hypothetical protein